MKQLLLLAVFSFLVLAGCQKENSIVSPVTEKSGSEIAAKAQGVQLISLPGNAEKSLKKSVLSCTELVKVNNVSVLKVENHYKAENGNDVKIKAELKVLKNSLDLDTYMTMSLEQNTLATSVSLDFGPSTQFKIPALLSIHAEGLDLSGFSPNDHIGLVYLDGDDWKPMPAKKVSFDINKGEIICIDAQIPHFSRYGFTRIDGSTDDSDASTADPVN